MPAVVLFSTYCGADADAFTKTDAGAHAVADARADARTDDGDARAHTTAVRGTDARTLVTTDNRSALIEADASALLFRFVLERQGYGCYRLR